jgi:hypothetical protein
MSESIRKRIESLESKVPVPITLTLSDSSTFKHRGPSLQFFVEGLAQIRAGRGPILSAVRDSVRSEGCGHLGDMLKALM